MFDFPSAAVVNRTVPKVKFHQNANLNARLKNLLTDQVKEIRWMMKLSPETTNSFVSPDRSQTFRIGSAPTRNDKRF